MPQVMRSPLPGSMFAGLSLGNCGMKSGSTLAALRKPGERYWPTPGKGGPVKSSFCTAGRKVWNDQLAARCRRASYGRCSQLTRNFI